MSGLKTYSPEFTNVVISNETTNHIITDYAEGGFISLEPTTERFVPVYGAKGESYRAHNPVKAFDLTLTLSQTSHSNDILSMLLDADRESLEGPFTLTFKDSSGTTIFTENSAYIGQEPSQSFSGGGTIESREWTIHLPNPSYRIGGNGRFSADNQSAVETLGGTVAAQWQAS
jgi:hypothetical protein